MTTTIKTQLFIFTIFLFLYSSLANAEDNYYKLKNINEVGWRIFFIKSTHNSASHTTTFHYLVGVENWEDNLHHWTLNFQHRYKPEIRSTDSFSLIHGTNGGIKGISWNQTVFPGSVKEFKITVYGLVQEQSIPFLVAGKNYIAKGFVTGPGKPISTYSPKKFNLSGTVYLDLKKDELKLADVRLSRVTVLVYNNHHQKVGEQQTDDKGRYRFTFKKGKYYIIVPAYRATRGNLFLNHYTSADTKLIHPIDLHADKHDIHIGFVLNKAALQAKLVATGLSTNHLSSLDWKNYKLRGCLDQYHDNQLMLDCLARQLRKTAAAGIKTARLHSGL